MDLYMLSWVLLIVAVGKTWPLTIDEMLQEVEGSDCPVDYKRCKDRSACIPIAYICDGSQDCRDNSDEDEFCVLGDSTAWDSYRLPDYPDIVFVKYQADILMPKDEFEEVYGERSTKARRKRYADYRLWGYKIPYKIGNEFNAKQRKTLHRVLEYWQQYTCLDFVDYDTYPAEKYIGIKKHDSECFSEIGKQVLTNETIVRLADGCFQNEGTLLIHELGHAIGLQHESQRSDRDMYLTIYENNIREKMHKNFVKLRSEDYENYRLEMPYDFLSVMHYGKHYFAKKKENGKKLVTMEPKEGYEQFRDIMGNVSGASYLDVKYLNTIYKCNDGCGAIKCPENAFLGKGCKCYCNQVEDWSNTRIPIKRCLEQCKETPSSVNTSVYGVDPLDMYSDLRTNISSCLYWESDPTCGMHCDEITCNAFGWNVSSLPECIKERCEFQEGWNQTFIEEYALEVAEDPPLPGRPHGYEMTLRCRNNESITSDMRCERGYWSDEVPSCHEDDTCALTEHRCADGSCVEHHHQDLRCDRKPDCQDESDEYGCELPRIISLSKNEVRVAMHGEVSIVCTASGEPIPDIHWLDGRIESTPHIPGRGHVHAKKTAPGSTTLTITDADIGDEGTYICRAQSNFGEDEQMIYIHVLEETCAADQLTCNDGTCKGELGLDIRCDGYPDCDDGSDESGCVKPNITSPVKDDTIEAKLGSTFSVRCIASGYLLPDITWLDGRVISMNHIPPTGRVRVDESVEGVSELTITDVTAYDEGLYICRAHSNYGEDIRYIDLIAVEGKPTCTSNEMQCKSGECISLNKRCDGQIDCTHREDEDNCQAPPSIVNLLETETREVRFRSKLTITCKASGYPSPTVTWRRGASSVGMRMGERVWASDGSKGDSTLTITKTWMKDRGVYSCWAVNSAGQDTHYVILTVTKDQNKCGQNKIQCPSGKCVPRSYLCDGYDDCGDDFDENHCAPPSIVNLSEDSKLGVRRGYTLSVNCKATGNPTPTVSWLDGRSVLLDEFPLTGRVRASYGSIGSSTLTIAMARREDAGLYVCRAVSSTGEDIHYVEITVT